MTGVVRKWQWVVMSWAACGFLGASMVTGDKRAGVLAGLVLFNALVSFLLELIEDPKDGKP